MEPRSWTPTSLSAGIPFSGASGKSVTAVLWGNGHTHPEVRGGRDALILRDRDGTRTELNVKKLVTH